METKGWIERLPSDTDRRIKLLRLSPAGRRLLARVAPAVRRVQDRLLAPLPEADRAAFVRLLSLLADLHHGATPAPLRSAAAD